MLGRSAPGNETEQLRGGERAGDLRTHAGPVLASGVDAVLHFAAVSLVGDSVAEPARYWRQNLGGTLALLDAMDAAQVRVMVFSSTAAVYGEPGRVPIDESAPERPVSPYGASKLAVDMILAERARQHRVGAASLPYFNVAGAHKDAAGRWYGERHEPETHLIPNILSVARGGSVPLRIFGTDYPTPDGTCIRDYIHVSDLGRAHLLALQACVPGRHHVYNLGSSSGFSCLQVLAACREVTGTDIPAEIAPRRPADPAVLVASSDHIRAELGWRPQRRLREMIGDAWEASRAPEPSR